MMKLPLYLIFYFKINLCFQIVNLEKNPEDDKLIINGFLSKNMNENKLNNKVNKHHIIMFFL